MNLKARTGFAAAALLGLAGCVGYTGPDEATTDTYAQRLLLKTEDAQFLVGTYHVVADSEQHSTFFGTAAAMEDSAQGRQLGVIFVERVEDIDKTNSVCMDYTFFTSKSSTWRELESGERRACVPK